ncbi:hypothetical protein [Embleya sp. NPDC059237]|uniref:hypothetical protein n=1 Tax=Embleya sp. NPDC059237 TaxID=3346784 RepID=UPI00367A3762
MTTDPEGAPSGLHFVPTPLELGDPTWVFPSVAEDEAAGVRTALAEADARLRETGAHLGVPGSVHYVGQHFDGIHCASVQGRLELPNGRSFLAALYFPRRCAFDLRWGPPWVSEVEIGRACPPPADCGGHPDAEWSREYDTPPAAALGFAADAARLRERVLARPRSAWLAAEPDAGCRPFDPAT